MTITITTAANVEYTIATEKPRRIRNRSRPRTIGSSSSAISAATMKRITA